jgi:hypothetical protein
MAFGFPAYHTERFVGLASSGDPRGVVLSALNSLSWPAHDQSGNVIHASSGMNFWSWGESISVEFLPGGELSITSQCALFTQCIDWGKNHSNVQALIAAIRKQMSTGLADAMSGSRGRG